MASSTPQPTTSLGVPTDKSQSVEDDSTELRLVLESAVRSAKELKQYAERARRENDRELATFFGRWAMSDEMRAVEATEILRSRTRLSATEIRTSAAFAAGDGADDADVSPDSRRGRVGIWPAL